MSKYDEKAWIGKLLFIGLDIHRKLWHLSIMTEDGLQLMSNQIPGSWRSLRSRLKRYKGAGGMCAVYEAGFSGFWLYDSLTNYGVDTIVTPPNKIPKAVGDRVKTDRIDSLRLAEYLRAGILRSIHIPTPKARAHRDVARIRRRFVRDRCRIQNRIKAFLRLMGLELPNESSGAWSNAFVSNLWSVQLQDAYHQESFRNLLEQYRLQDELVKTQTRLLRDLSRSKEYCNRVELLRTVPGVGWLTALEFLLEIQDVSRFSRGRQIGAYLGLTPTQLSSGERVRMGRITKQGIGSLRGLLVEASWLLIRKDQNMRDRYQRIRNRAGGKRAIVAVARSLAIRMRRMLLDCEHYRLVPVA